MATNGTLTWRWLGGILLTVILAAGGAWMSGMASEVNKVKDEQKQDRQTTQDVKAKVGVIEEQTKRTQEDIQELKRNQEKHGNKLDEILRRIPIR